VTVAVVVKVFDGIIVAADSATTLPLVQGGAQVYTGANKVFHLHRRLPVAAMTWGLGAVGPASIATLTKDLRRRLMGKDEANPTWEVDEASYTIEGIADRYIEMFHGEVYSTTIGPNVTPGDEGPVLGMLIVGFSANETQPEAWEVVIKDPHGAPTATRLMGQDDYGWMTFAQPEATERLFYGVDPATFAALKASLPADVWNNTVMPLVVQAQRNPVVPGMPLADTIELADFLASVTAQYSHFLLGPDTVGGVVDIAAISRHEGFRWVRRKHYYSRDLNPWGHDHD
jgi:hypothetical protein